MTDSNTVKELKKLEKIINKIDFSKIKHDRDLTDLQRIALNAYDNIENILTESLFDYDKLLRSLNIQAIIDDE